MKKITALLLAIMMLLSLATAFADEGSEPDWTRYDELIAQIKSSTDFVAREALMHEAEDILMDTGAIVPIYYYNDVYMAKPDFQGVYSNAYGMKHFEYATNGDKNSAKINLSSEPDKLDPALNSSVDGACLAIASFGGLYTYDAESNLQPNFATGYEVSEDGLTYVFTMREGLKWSDGSPLTAKDFEYSWKRAANPETAADYAYMFNGIKGYPNELAVSASEDGTTFTVELMAPCAYMLDLAAFPTFYAVQQATVEAAEGYKDEAGNVVNPGAWALDAGFVSSGPYVLTEWNHDENMIYSKNPNYWDAENVKLETLEFMLSADETVVYAAYAAGDLDFIDSVPTDEIAKLKDSPEFYTVGQLGTYYICFNVKSPLFDGKTVEQAANMRKAISYLIDREYIAENIGQTGQVPATSFLPAGIADGHGGIFKANDEAYTYADEESAGYFPVAYDPEASVAKAVELLKSAGFEFDDNNQLSADTPISFEYLTNASSGHIAIAEAVQQDLAVVGITMTIKSIDWNVFLNERKEGKYDVARNGWIADFNDPINMLEMWATDSGNNDVQFGR
ncbi:MAG: peptide ABC transporter substrate-binding protein [Christensenellaceae bacterium]|nr:peptide ABC transporter substrate-binding protein [Christensenellaceae bacterium]